MKNLGILLLFAVGCSKEESQAELKDILDDTATPDTDDPSTENCEVTIAGTSPNDGFGGWFYRDPVVITFSEGNPNVSFSVQNAAGEDVPVDHEWDDVRINASIMPSSGDWMATESYSLQIDLCGNQPQIGFTVSDIGSPLEIAGSELIGSTYFIDLSSADYIEPPGVGTLLSLFLDMPLLLGVSAVSEGVIDFEAYLGVQDDVTGDWSPVSMDPWIFDGADFTQSPYFAASTELLDIPYGDVDIPVHGFAIDGTFSVDGSTIHEAMFTGLGDTSGMGPLMGFGNDPNAVCELLSDYGITCQDCPDGAGQYCVTLTGIIETADLIPGLDVVQ